MFTSCSQKHVYKSIRFGIFQAQETEDLYSVPKTDTLRNSIQSSKVEKAFTLHCTLVLKASNGGRDRGVDFCSSLPINPSRPMSWFLRFMSFLHALCFDGPLPFSHPLFFVATLMYQDPSLRGLGCVGIMWNKSVHYLSLHSVLSV